MNVEIQSSYKQSVTASVAQWLEHWSSLPGVKSSILCIGLFITLDRYFSLLVTNVFQKSFTLIENLFKTIFLEYDNITLLFVKC